MIFEDSEDWSNDNWELFAITGINYILKSKIVNIYFEL